MQLTRFFVKKILSLTFLVLFYSTCLSKLSNDNLFAKTDSLLRLDKCKEVIKILSSQRLRNSIPLYIQYLRSHEICNNNIYALTESLKLLKKGNLHPDEKARLYLLNAKLYEKVSDRMSAKSSLKRCKAYISHKTPADIMQIWNVRMSSYYRVMTTKKDSASYYAKQALQYQSGEVASAYFLNAYLASDLKEQEYFMKKSIKYFDSIKNRYVAGALKLSLASIYRDHNKSYLYEKNFHEGVRILSDYKEDTNRVELYKHFKKYYLDKNDFKMALLYSDSLSIVNKNIDSIYNIVQISTLEKKYDHKQNELKIANISAHVKEKNKTNNILILLVCLFVIFSFIIIRLIFVLNTKKKLISMKSNLLSKNNVHLRETLKYNEILMKENNHRVKNNLMMLAGMMKIETSKTDNDLLKRKLAEIENRIHSISAIHKYIYQVNNYSSINIQAVLNDVILKTQEELVPIHLSQCICLHSESLEMEISKAIPLILIINELLTNSIKYALHSENDKVIISLNKFQNEVMLKVADTGCGYKQIQKIGEIKSTGLYLVGILVKQLRGELTHYESEKNISTTQLVFNL